MTRSKKQMPSTSKEFFGKLDTRFYINNLRIAQLMKQVFLRIHYVCIYVHIFLLVNTHLNIAFCESHFDLIFLILCIYFWHFNVFSPYCNMRIMKDKLINVQFEYLVIHVILSYFILECILF